MGADKFVQGQRYRVTFEGVIDEDGELQVGRPYQYVYLSRSALGRASSVEKIEPPIKEGDLFTDPNGALFVSKGGDEYRLIRHETGQLAVTPELRWSAASIATPLTRVTVTPA